MRKRKTWNPKRGFAEAYDLEALNDLAGKIKYGGNPEHKRNPGDFGLTPPASPRADKTLCDRIGIFEKRIAEELLAQGVRRGLISGQWRGGFPQNIWAVTDIGQPVEAQLENETLGIYHGYPMPEGDPFQEQVMERWKISTRNNP